MNIEKFNQEKIEGGERVLLREQEARELPEDPSKMTYRGRYENLDIETLQLIGLEEMPKDKELRFLDFAGGVLPFGSPTAHDLIDRIESAGHKVDITVVDKFIPEDFHPDYKEVRYSQSLGETKKRFDVVRVLNLVEHLSKMKYEEIRKQLVKRLRVGGLFISTQGLQYYYQGNDDIFLLPPIIKIMQKRTDKLGRSVMVPIGLLPEPVVAWTASSAWGRKGHDEILLEYSKFRNDVKEGREKIPKELDEDGFKTALRFMNCDIPTTLRVLQSETFGVLPEGKTENSGDILAVIKENRKDVKDWFAT